MCLHGDNQSKYNLKWKHHVKLVSESESLGTRLTLVGGRGAEMICLEKKVKQGSE